MDVRHINFTFSSSHPFYFPFLFFGSYGLHRLHFSCKSTSFLLYINIPTGHLRWTVLFSFFIPFIFFCVGEAASLPEE